MTHTQERSIYKYFKKDAIKRLEHNIYKADFVECKLSTTHARKAPSGQLVEVKLHKLWKTHPITILYTTLHYTKYLRISLLGIGTVLSDAIINYM